VRKGNCKVTRQPIPLKPTLQTEFARFIGDIKHFGYNFDNHHLNIISRKNPTALSQYLFINRSQFGSKIKFLGSKAHFLLFAQFCN